MSLTEGEIINIINSNTYFKTNPITGIEYSTDTIQWIAQNIWDGFPEIHDPSVIILWVRALGPHLDRALIKEYWSRLALEIVGAERQINMRGQRRKAEKRQRGIREQGRRVQKEKIAEQMNFKEIRAMVQGLQKRGGEDLVAVKDEEEEEEEEEEERPERFSTKRKRRISIESEDGSLIDRKCFARPRPSSSEKAWTYHHHAASPKKSKAMNPDREFPHLSVNVPKSKTILHHQTSPIDEDEGVKKPLRNSNLSSSVSPQPFILEDSESLTRGFFGDGVVTTPHTSDTHSGDTASSECVSDDKSNKENEDVGEVEGELASDLGVAVGDSKVKEAEAES